MGDPYFESLMQHRQALLWAIGTRRQLDRWEPPVVEHLSRANSTMKMPAALIWQGEIDRHLALVSANHMFTAMDLWPDPVPVPKLLRDEINETRDLNEHWDDNMPVFNQHPRQETPKRRTGRSFAERNPVLGPYCWWAWDSSRGAMLTPNVAATEVRDVITAIEVATLLGQPELARFIPPAVPSPWARDADGNWFPPEWASSPA
jgi:hypothetical protein